MATIGNIAAIASSTGAISPALPTGLVTDDTLLIFVAQNKTAVPDTALTIANAGGGVWTRIGNSHANTGTRLTVWWSRYNGTQTSPTTNDTGDHQMGRIFAIDGAVLTGDPINVEAGAASIFAQTTTTLPTVTTTEDNTLILDCVALAGPDEVGSAVFSGWANAGLTGYTEIIDNSVADGAGGAIGVAAGTKTSAGATGTSTVTHASWHAAWKKIAIRSEGEAPPPPPPPPAGGVTVGRRASDGAVTFDDVPSLIRGLYDSGYAGVNNQDMAGHLVARNIARFTGYLNAYLHTQSGTVGNGLRLADALVPLGMHAVAVGNAAYNWSLQQSTTVQENSDANGHFDVVENYDNFRTAFAGKPAAAAVYLWDETREDALADLATWQTTYSTAMPSLATFGVCWHSFISAIKDYAASTVGNWLAADPYPIGQNAESTPGGTANSYGYSNYDVGYTAAAVRYWGLLGGKSPMMVLQAFKFGSPSRFITTDEMWSHMIAAIAEGCVGVWWWAEGIQNGALRTAMWTETERTRVLNQIEAISALLAQLEPAILSGANPGLLTANSTSIGPTLADAITWRKTMLGLLDDTGVDGPAWLNDMRLVFVDELALLNLGTPDTSMSDHLLDQAGNVRTRCYEYGGYGYVFAYNLHPQAQTNVSLSWYAAITRVEVLGESRDCTVQGDTTTWIDTFGGGSSLRQGTFRQGHIYKIYPSGLPALPPTAPSLTVYSLATMTLSLLPGTGATSHALYRGTTSTFVANATTLIATFGALPPTLYTDGATLEPTTTYYYRLAAVNAAGTTYSVTVALVTPAAPSLTVFVYYVLGETQFRSTTNIADAMGPDKAVIAVYVHGTGIMANWGRVLIHGSDIMANTIGANQLVANAAIITGAIQIAAEVVNSSHISDLTVSKVTGGDVLADLLIGTGRIATAASGARVELAAGGINVYDSLDRSVFEAKHQTPFVRIGRTGASVPPLQLSSSGDFIQLVTTQLNAFAVTRATLLQGSAATIKPAGGGENWGPVTLLNYPSAIQSMRSGDRLMGWWQVTVGLSHTGNSSAVGWVRMLINGSQIAIVNVTMAFSVNGDSTSVSQMIPVLLSVGAIWNSVQMQAYMSAANDAESQISLSTSNLLLLVASA